MAMPATIMYPGNVTAVYGYDFVDRPATLRAQRPGKPDQLLVTGAAYLPAGPLSSLALGNGLTETRSFTSRYFPSAITLGPANLLSWSYTTDSVGNVKTIADTLNAATGTDATTFTNDAAGHLAALERTTPRAGTAFRYDGRGFLTLADASALPFLDGFESGNVCSWSAALGLAATPTCTTPAPPAVHSTYSSECLLHAVQRNAAPDRSLLFHFAGRPVAQLDLTGTTESWKYLTTDHLGTPTAATSTAGALLWQGGFEPFGADWSGAGGAGVFLRLPGQWEGKAWIGLDYNLQRWYESGTGRYTQPDPLGLGGGINLFRYAIANPLVFSDPTGQRFSLVNFPPGELSQGQEAIQRIKDTLKKQPCCIKQDRAKSILDAIDSSEEVLQFIYKADLHYCGYTPFRTMVGVSNVVQIGPHAANCCKGGNPKGLDAFASTLLHEMHHALFGTGDGAAYAAEKKCFNCNE